MDEEVDELDLGNDLLSQNFDSICLASYRTAAKLRFIQRRTHCSFFLLLHHSFAVLLTVFFLFICSAPN